MAKKRHQAKHIGCFESRAINLPDRQLSAEHPVVINVVSSNGEVVTGTFPRDASGWKAAIAFACSDLTFRESMLAGGQDFPKWFRRIAIAEGLIPNFDDNKMAGNKVRISSTRMLT